MEQHESAANLKAITEEVKSLRREFNIRLSQIEQKLEDNDYQTQQLNNLRLDANVRLDRILAALHKNLSFVYQAQAEMMLIEAKKNLSKEDFGKLLMKL